MYKKHTEYRSVVLYYFVQRLCYIGCTRARFSHRPRGKVRPPCMLRRAAFQKEHRQTEGKKSFRSYSASSLQPTSMLEVGQWRRRREEGKRKRVCQCRISVTSTNTHSSLISSSNSITPPCS